MKIRTDFVSNSSSSSFIIFGERIDNKTNNIEKMEELLKKDQLYGRGDGYEASDFFKITPAMFEIIKDEYPHKYIEFMRVYYCVSEIGGINTKELPEKVQVMSMEVDHHSTSTLEEFQENYYNEN